MKFRTHLALAMLAIWPVLLGPTQQMIGHDQGDVWNHAWGSWWFWQSLLDGTLPWHTEWLNAPNGGTLWFIDPIGALIGLPFAALFGPILAFNATVLVYAAATSWAAARLVARISGPGLHCLAASFAILFGPYLLSEVHNGISEACNLAPAILALTAGHDALQKGERRDWRHLAFFLALTGLGSFYYLLGTSLVLAVWGIFWSATRPPVAQWIFAIKSGLLAAAFILPLALIMKASVHADSPLIFRDGGDMAILQLHNAVDPRTYLWPFGFQSVDLESQGEAFLHSGYIGWTVLVLAVLNWRTQALRSWFAAIGVLLVLGLGARLSFNGSWVELSSGATLALPYAFLQKLLPSEALTHSLRVAMPALVLLAVLAAASLSRWTRNHTLLVLAWIPFEMVVIGGSPWPPERTNPLETSYIQHIQEQDTHGVVLDLPGAVGNSMATSRYLVLQSKHRLPIPYKPDARASTSALMGDPTLALLALASEPRPNHRTTLLQAVSQRQKLRASSLYDRGIRWIVVHEYLDQPPEAQQVTHDILEALYGAGKRFDQSVVYNVSPTNREVDTKEEWLESLKGLKL
jgi:hypothetical protein